MVIADYGFLDLRHTALQPEPGEVLLRAAPSIEGEGAALGARVLVPRDDHRPTLADMFVCSLAARAVDGRPVPGAFSRWLEHVRRKPEIGEVPFELSLLGAFEALKRSAGPAGEKDRLLAAWPALEAAIDVAMAASVPPERLCLTAPEQAVCRLLLCADRRRFEADLERSELWHCRPPDGERAAGVVLVEPSSQLYRMWLERSDWVAFEGGHYVLAVNIQRAWTIRRDAALETSLDGLREKLQAAEEAESPQLGRADPWTLEEGGACLLAPLAGSQLSRELVCETLRGWLSAAPLRPLRGKQRDQLVRNWKKTFPAYTQVEPVLPSEEAHTEPVPHFRARDQRGLEVSIRVHGVFDSIETEHGRLTREIDKLRDIERCCRESEAGRRPRILTLRRVRFADSRRRLLGLVHPGGYETLRSWREARKTVAINDLLCIVRDVAGALEQLHEWGFQHLDLQPAHVLVSTRQPRPRALVTGCGLSVAGDGFLSHLPDLVFAPPDMRRACKEWDVFSFVLVVAYLVRGDTSGSFRDPRDGGVHRDILADARQRRAVDGVEEPWYDRLARLLHEAAAHPPPLAEVRDAIVDLPLDASGATSAERFFEDVIEDDDAAEFAEIPSDPPSGFQHTRLLPKGEIEAPAPAQEPEPEAEPEPPAPIDLDDEPSTSDHPPTAVVEVPFANTIRKTDRLSEYYGRLMEHSGEGAREDKVVKAPRIYTPSPTSADAEEVSDGLGEAESDAPAMEVSDARPGKIMNTMEFFAAMHDNAIAPDGYPAPLGPTAEFPAPRQAGARARGQGELPKPPSGRLRRPVSGRLERPSGRTSGAATGRLPIVPPAPLRADSSTIRRIHAKRRRPKDGPPSGGHDAFDRPGAYRAFDSSDSDRAAPGTGRRPSASGERKAFDPEEGRRGSGRERRGPSSSGGRRPVPASGERKASDPDRRGGTGRTPSSGERRSPPSGERRAYGGPSSGFQRQGRRRPESERQRVSRQQETGRGRGRRPAKAAKGAPQKYSRVLGNVGLIKRLGAGGFASVYLGQHLKLNVKVAVKVLTKKAANERVVNRFFMEANLLKKIDSPHVVRVYELGEVEGLQYIVMEFINGWSLEDLLKMVKSKKRPGLEPLSALVITESATRGLAELHKLGVIHRDVKPANIMIPRNADPDQSERVQQQTIEGILPPELRMCKLIDLGIAKTEQSNLTQTGVGMGTLGYAPPEQLVEAKEVTPASDVFSMGATLYYLLAGRPPFEGKFSEVVTATLNGKYVPLFMRCPGTPRRVDKLVQRCLSKDADKRFQDGGALLKALEETRRSLAKG